MSPASEIGQRIREGLPDVESVLIVLLCLSVLLILLKSMGIDVLDSLAEMSAGDLRRVLIPLVLGVLSVLVEWIRDGLDDPTGTTEGRDPLGESESSTDGEGDCEFDDAADERATATESVEFAGPH